VNCSKRIWIRQNAAPTIVSNSLSSSSLIADNITPYSITLNGSDPDGVADLVDMRILLDDGVYIRHFLEETDAEKLRVGMRVEAVWKEDHERGEGTADVKYFRTIEE